MTEYQTKLLEIMKGPNKQVRERHCYLTQGSTELKELLAKQKRGKHWRLENGKRIWY